MRAPSKQRDLFDRVNADAEERRQRREAFARRKLSSLPSLLVQLGLGLAAHQDQTGYGELVAWLSEIELSIEDMRELILIARHIADSPLSEDQQRRIGALVFSTEVLHAISAIVSEPKA